MEAFKDNINESNKQKERSVNFGLKRIDNLKDIQNLDSSTRKQYKNSLIIYGYLIINYFNYYKTYFVFSLKYFPFFLVYLFYYSSLKKCHSGEAICSFRLDWIMRRVREEIYSCILMALIIQLMIFNILSKKHLIHMIAIFALFYVYSHGMYFHDHGYYNFYFYFVVLSIIIIILIPLDCILFYNKKKIFI